MSILGKNYDTEIQETLTSDFSTGTLTSVNANGDQLQLNSTTSTAYGVTGLPASYSSASSLQERGWEFKVGSNPITVNKLRLYYNSADGGTSTTLKLWDATSKALLASVDVTKPGSTSWVEGTLSNPVTLNANASYSISWDTGGTWYYAGSGYTLNTSLISYVTCLYGSQNAYPTTSGGTWTPIDIVVQTNSYNSSGNRVSPDYTIPTGASDSVISWNATIPTNTTITIETSIDSGTTWQTATNGAAIPNISSETGKIRVRETLSTTNSTSTPILSDLSIGVSGPQIINGYDTEMLSMADISTVSINYNLQGSSAITLSDTSSETTVIAYHLQSTESLTITESGQTQLTDAVSTESLTVSDSSNLSVHYDLQGSDSLIISDESTNSVQINVIGSNSLITTENSNLVAISQTFNGSDVITSSDTNTIKIKVERDEVGFSTGTFSSTIAKAWDMNGDIGVELATENYQKTGSTLYNGVTSATKDSINQIENSTNMVEGWNFTVGSQPIVVTKLGVNVANASGTTVAIYDSAGNVVVQGSFTTAIGPDSFSYVSIASTTLSANTQYTVAAMLPSYVASYNYSSTSEIVFNTTGITYNSWVQTSSSTMVKPTTAATWAQIIPTFEYNTTSVQSGYALSGTYTTEAIDISPALVAYDSRIKWDFQDEPTGVPYTSISVETSIDGGTTWTSVNSGDNIPGLTGSVALTGKTLLARFTLSTSNRSYTPVLTGAVLDVSNGALTKTLKLFSIASYAIKKTYNESITTTYAVKRELIDNVNSSYAVKVNEPVTAISNFAIKNSENVTSIASYAIKKALNEQLVSSYAIKVNESLSLAPSYAIKNVLSDVVDVNFAIKVNESLPMSSSYAIKRAVNEQLVSSYAVKRSLSEPLISSYAIKQPLNEQFTSSYAIKQQLSDYLIANYSVKNTYTLDVPVVASFAIKGQLNEPMIANLAIKRSLNEQLTSDYAIKRQLNDNLISNFAIKNSQNAKAMVNYAVKATLPVEINSNYAIRTKLIDYMIANYAIKDTSTLIVSAAATFAVKNTYVVEVDGEYAVLALNKETGILLTGFINKEQVLSGISNYGSTITGISNKGVTLS